MLDYPVTKCAKLHLETLSLSNFKVGGGIVMGHPVTKALEGSCCNLYCFDVVYIYDKTYPVFSGHR